ncbi:hypothetical protein ACUN7V_00935 [Quadrisphaera oryzae]|uniref:hypothetical protein n=1 Tax=Quadrisphaera TaxID=317661 RepID=UPI0016485878|nr:hypothetical protein [Quadrisphaera sp. RL12-1S]MBC3762595.1 hypothetical protein [Quadrisphaera sp. RL12-1S]
MGDVQISAAATLVAAIVAVLGSIGTVALSALFQRRYLRADLAGQAVERRAQWERENAQSASAGKAAACAAFDAAVVRAVGRLQRAIDLADQPRVRRKLLGLGWAQRWEEDIQQAAFDIALPYSTLRFAADPQILTAAEDVIKALTKVTAAMSAVPTPLPPSPMAVFKTSARKRWRASIDRELSGLHAARRHLISAVDASARRTSRER